jgi:Spy/CpxP family protein refolding chaperone
MKKMIMAGIAILVTAITFAQPEKDGPSKPPPLEKRWEKDSGKIKSAVSLTADEQAKMKTAFMAFYTEMDALREKNKAQRPAREEVERVAQKRNDAIKKFLSKDKFEKFMGVEKQLGPPKPKDGPPAN